MLAKPPGFPSLPAMPVLEADTQIEAFISRWSKSSGKERANFQPFAEHLCEILEVAKPAGSVHETSQNTYAYERDVEFKNPDGTTNPGRIDLYKKDCFVLEAKQSRWKGEAKQLAGQSDLFVPESVADQKKRGGGAWDALMANAHRQAVDYVRALDDKNPPFVLVCDVGYCIEVYADFTGQGKYYARFPDPQGYRIYLDDLKRPEIRERLRLIWTDPHKLDPEKQSAKVTREIAKRLAEVSKSLEARGHNAEDVAHFLMRCLFTMFAEDAKLLPEGCFTRWLASARDNTSKFKHELAQLWQSMDNGGYATVAEAEVKSFNGSFFRSATVLDLEREEIGELLKAAKANWKDVDPAIFGTLLEQALSKKDRDRLGAHYTPRAYVQRLVLVTVMEPLRQDWAQVQATAERLFREERKKDALQVVRDFHHKLCTTRVLDPACGTGNFLYVALEMMKELESEVVDLVIEFGGQERLSWMERETVGPKQFLGLEINPRAKDIAELVVWLGYLKQHYRIKAAHPPEPILDDFGNIRHMDAVLTWDGYPAPKVETKDGRRVETYPNARKPDWPPAEFIVGNPPFIGGKDIREQQGGGYAETLWSVHKDINESADFVMYWWDRAASALTRKKSPLRRFGFVTTNSITQVFSRRVVAKHLAAKQPISLLMAMSDHPWTKATDKAAAVRIAMTVASAGRHEGVVREVTHESAVDTDEPIIELSAKTGRINADLTVGADVTAAVALTANEGVSSPGVKLHGDGFIVTPAEAEALGLGKRVGLDKHIRHYRNGRDLTGIPRGVMVIDLFGLEADDVRKRFPEVYQHLTETVKAARQTQFERSPTRDAREYLDRWWTFGKPREELRPALAGLPRYIATVETAKHRTFQFLDAAILPDNMLVCMGLDDAYYLGVLSSRIHVTWALRAGGWLGVGNDPRYSKSRCFDPFAFPDCSDALRAKIRAVAEELDAHRKARQAEHPGLALTQMYNVLEKLRGEEELDEDDERIKMQGLVKILKELHDKLDALVFEAYSWPQTLSDEEILERLVALSKERAAEEKAGKVRWLRPNYQIPRFGSDVERARLEEERRTIRAKERQAALDFDDDLQEMKPEFPTENELAETAAVMRVLATAAASLSIQDVARHFKQGLKVEKRVALTMLALARLGHIASADNAETFSIRKVA